MPSTYRAMVFSAPGQPLHLERRARLEPGPGQIRVKVLACGVCRTDLHFADGELPQTHYPIVPGHEVVGRIEALGFGVEHLRVGERVGVPWLGHTCGHCDYCQAQHENLCDAPEFTGCTRDGGFAEEMIADASFAFPLGETGEDVALAPLLCAGLIGWRSLRLAGTGKRIGLYGFGAAAHILAQVLVRQGREVYAFTKDGDDKGQAFARSLGATWAGGSAAAPPVLLDAAILFAPAGELVVSALKAVKKGGKVVCGGIHMSDIPSFPYEILWEEREIKSVANLTRQDGLEFLSKAPGFDLSLTTQVYPLEEANRALDDLRHGRFEGAAVLVP